MSKHKEVKMAHFFTKTLLYPLMRLFFVKEIKGLDNLPKKTPYIIVSNHASYIDGVLILLTLLWHKDKTVHFFMTKSMFNTAFRRFVFSAWFKQIKENHSVQKGIEYLEKDELVGIFPEGGRTYTGKMQKAKGTGLGVLALKTRLPVVPIGLENNFELWSRFEKWPEFQRLVTINIGKPMRFNSGMNKKNYNAVISKVMKRVAKLANNEYKW